MNTITELAAQIRGLAEAATPGEWRFVNHNNEPELSQASDDFSIVSADGKVIVSEPSCLLDRLPMVCNGPYIAAANPANIIKLLGALEAAQAEVARLTQDRDEWKESTVMANENQRRSDAKAHAMQEERDAALARLAELKTRLQQIGDLAASCRSGPALREALVQIEAMATSAASQQPADPMDWQLPCDVTVGHGTMQKGVKLSTLVTRMKALYEMATGQNADEVAGRSNAARDVLAERQRQITIEGRSLDHDDTNRSGQLARAASSYARHAGFSLETGKWMVAQPREWPWSPAWWKPSDPRRNLVKAGALILAEIERIDRSSIGTKEAS